MKITDLRAYVVRAQESRPWMFVEIDTDEGITGFGRVDERRWRWRNRHRPDLRPVKTRSRRAGFLGRVSRTRPLTTSTASGIRSIAVSGHSDRAVSRRRLPAVSIWLFGT